MVISSIWTIDLNYSVFYNVLLKIAIDRDDNAPPGIRASGNFLIFSSVAYYCS
jgi:hypothetical protein